MFGWRARIGLLIPSSNTTMEMESARYVPEGISVHTARLPLEKVTSRELIKMAERAEEAAKLLADAGVDNISHMERSLQILHPLLDPPIL